LGFEWETALLFVFSHIGKVQYEAGPSPGSRPDITFVEESDKPIRFTADIATVSYYGLESENPAMRRQAQILLRRQCWSRATLVF